MLNIFFMRLLAFCRNSLSFYLNSLDNIHCNISFCCTKHVSIWNGSMIIFFHSLLNVCSKYILKEDAMYLFSDCIGFGTLARLDKTGKNWLVSFPTGHLSVGLCVVGYQKCRPLMDLVFWSFIDLSCRSYMIWWLCIICLIFFS